MAHNTKANAYYFYVILWITKNRVSFHYKTLEMMLFCIRITHNTARREKSCVRNTAYTAIPSRKNSVRRIPASFPS